MRYAFLFISICLLALPTASAQDEQKEQEKIVVALSPEGVPQAFEIYSVQLTEYSTQSPLDPKLTTSEIVERLSNSEGDDAIQPVETIRLSALSDNEATVNFGRTVPVTTGGVSDGRGTIHRTTTATTVGTLVRLTAIPQGDKVLVNLSYASSRVAGEGTVDSPPDITHNRITTSMLVVVGQPTLIGGFSGSESSLVLLTLGR